MAFAASDSLDLLLLLAPSAGTLAAGAAAAAPPACKACAESMSHSVRARRLVGMPWRNEQPGSQFNNTGAWSILKVRREYD